MGLARRPGLLTCVAASLLMRFSDSPLTLAGLTVADFKSVSLSLSSGERLKGGLWRQTGLGLGSGSVTTSPVTLGRELGFSKPQVPHL